MKTQFLLPLTLATWMLSTMTEAAPMARDGKSTTSTAALPPLIPERVQPIGSLPKFNMSMETAISKENGPLPPGVEKKGPWSLETPSNSTAQSERLSTRSSNSVTIASTAQVSASFFRAELAADAYCRKVVPGNVWDCPHCQTALPDAKIEVTFSTVLDDTNGYIASSKKEKTIYVVFRGTNSIRSAIVDMQFIKSSYPPVKGAQIHTGFYKSYLSVQDTVVGTMNKLLTQYPDYKVEVTGHSLGAAQGVLAAMDLYQRFKQLTPSNTKIYTYGEPRVGNQQFAAYVLSTGIPKIRTVHASDIVPHLPPMDLGFLHSGTEYWIKDNTSKKTEICTAEFESSECSNTAVPFLSILDHLDYYGVNQGLCL